VPSVAPAAPPPRPASAGSGPARGPRALPIARRGAVRAGPFGYAVARAYAGHTDNGNDVGTTATYVRASLHEVAAALSALTGEPHPLV
jgi:hypothetical protein